VSEPAQRPVAEAAADAAGLRRAFARSVRFNLQAEFFIHVIRVGGLVFLAHRLAPSDFGLLRILIVIVGLAGLTSNGGFCEALIQRQTLSGAHESTALCLTMFLSIITAGALFFAAPLIAWAMAMPDLTGMVRLIALPLLVEGASGISNARLRRDLKYGTLAVADVFAELAFLVVASALLMSGRPRLSLAAGLGARSLVRGGITIGFGTFRVKHMPTLLAARELWQFASRSFGGQGLVLISQNADYVVVGRLLGNVELGYYSLAWDLLRFVPERLYRIVGRVTLPVFSRLQNQDAELSAHYYDLIAMLARLLIPAMAVIAVAAPTVVATLYGAKWLPAAVPLRILALGLTLVGLRLAIGSVYYAKNHPEFDIYLHGVRVTLIVAVIGLLAPYGLIAVCIGMSAIESVIGVAGQWIVCTLLGLQKTRLASSIIPGVLTAAGCAAAAAIAVALGNLIALDRPLKLALILAFSGGVFLWRERESLFSMLQASSAAANTTQAVAPAIAPVIGG